MACARTYQLSSMQPIRYEKDTGVSDVGGESNTSDETAYVKLEHSRAHYLCNTFHLSLSSRWRAHLHTTDVPDVALEKQHGTILLDVGLMCIAEV